MSMNKQIKDAFNEIRAEEQLKDATKAYIAQQLTQKTPVKKSLRPMFAALAACVTIFFLCVGGGWIYLTPTAVASFDVNPSMEIGINCFDRVVSVKGYNDDGKALADGLHIHHMEYEKAMEEILKEEQVKNLLEDGYLTIAVAGSDEEQCARVLDTAKNCTKGHRNTHCYIAGEEELDSAHDLGMSCGKYRAYQELKALDPDITPEEVQAMTMREIRDRIAALSEDTKEESAPQAQAEDIDTEDIGACDIDTEDIDTEDIDTEDIDAEDIDTEDIITEDINTEDTEIEMQSQSECRGQGNGYRHHNEGHGHY